MPVMPWPWCRAGGEFELRYVEQPRTENPQPERFDSVSQGVSNSWIGDGGCKPRADARSGSHCATAAPAAAQAVKLVLFEERSGSPAVGLLSARGIVALDREAAAGETPQGMMEDVIEHYHDLEVERLAEQGPALAPDTVRLLAPLPEPGKVLCRVANFGADGDDPPSRQLYLKNPDAVVGPGGSLMLPNERGPFLLEPELGVVIRDNAVFGYTCFMDVTRPPADEWGVSWQKSFDTHCAIGPWIVTSDELTPERVDVSSLLEFAREVMTLCTGDLLACGAEADQVREIRGGQRAEMEIEGIGRLAVEVA